MKKWLSWEATQPPPNASGCVEAQTPAGEVHRLHYLFYRDAEGVWGHTTGDWREGTNKTFHGPYVCWRYLGPTLPPKRTQGRAILVWEWWEAPGELRALSPHGGDEDYVALVPEDMSPPSWMHSGTSFGCCDVSEHQLPDGRWVYIGAHA